MTTLMSVSLKRLALFHTMYLRYWHLRFPHQKEKIHPNENETFISKKF